MVNGRLGFCGGVVVMGDVMWAGRARGVWGLLWMWRSVVCVKESWQRLHVIGRGSHVSGTSSFDSFPFLYT